MTKLLDDAVAVARALPPNVQNDLAQMMRLYARAPIVELTPEEDADLAEADAEIARGDLASADEIDRLWAKYGR